MKLVTKIISILLLIFIPIYGFTQCQEYTEKEVLPLLGDYMQSGRYNSMKMYEGDEMVVYKSLSKGISYRFVVACSAELSPYVEFNVVDWDNKKLFSNKTSDHSNVWDYLSVSSGRIRIIIRIPVTSKSDQLKKGCVGMISGFKK